MEKYSINNQTVSILLSWVQSGVVAIPEIQRPFVWSKSQVRNLMDSLYQGYPVGYIITWQNPHVRLKDGTTSQGKHVLIDGQQRITALRAAILGKEIGIAILGLHVLILLRFAILKKNKWKWLRSQKIPIAALLGLICVAICYLLLRMTALNFVNSFNFYGNSESLYAQSLVVRVLTFSKIIWIYLPWQRQQHLVVWKKHNHHHKPSARVRAR